MRSQAVTLRDRVCSTSFYKVQSYTQCFVVLAIQFSVPGGRHLDTAQIYGNHKAASWLRGSVFLPRSPFGGWVLLQVFEGRGIYFCHSVFLAFFLGGVWGGGWVVGWGTGGCGGRSLGGNLHRLNIDIRYKFGGQSSKMRLETYARKESPRSANFSQRLGKLRPRKPFCSHAWQACSPRALRTSAKAAST